MRASDYVGHAWANLWKKKLRTVLTTGGVVIGIGSLICMFAFGQGIQRNIKDRFTELELFNYINVSPRSGGGARPADFRRHARSQPAGDPNEPIAVLDDDLLEELMRIEGVEAAYPEMRFPAQIRLGSR